MKNNTLQQVLFEALSKFKHNTAVQCGNRLVTYTEVDNQSDYIANILIKKGIEKETFVGILIRDRPTLIFTMIGILKARCVFVPLNPAYPQERLEQMIHSTQINYVFSDEINFLRLANSINKKRRVEFILINSNGIPDEGDTQLFNRPEVSYHPGDKIYVYFTSGTTGMPRAIIGKNKSLLHFINWEIETFNIDSSFRISQFAPPDFDAFLKDLFVPLCAGGCVCIPGNKEIMSDAEKLTRWIDRKRIHLIHCVPSLFRFINSNTLNKNLFKELKFVLMAGEKIHPSDLVRWYQTFDERIQLVNLYGPTETTLIKTCYFIRKTDLNCDRIPVGKPIKGSRVLIFDENNKMCEQLTVGEIHIRTPFSTWGYCNHPQLNQQKFIKNPFNRNPDDTLFKTGDLGRFLFDGNIDFQGRMDRQVKIWGNRIELEEIERVLVSHPSIKEAAVINEKLENNNDILYAAIVKERGEKTNNTEETTLISQVENYLSKKLPAYMVPGHIKIIAKMPLRPGGKVDFDALSRMFHDEKKIIIQPGNETEKKLLEMWSEILGTQEIGINNRFFRMGGNSLNLISLISKIHQEFAVRISLAEIYKNLTVEKQAKIIIRAKKEKFGPIASACLKEYYELSRAQEDIYANHQEGKKRKTPAILLLKRLEGEPKRKQLEHAFRQLVKRHESLRTSFQFLDNQPVQKIHTYESVDVKPGYYEMQEDKARRFLKNFTRILEPTKVPLLKVGLIKVMEKKYILALGLHEIIYDGTSVRILEEEFIALYAGKRLPPLKLQYKDYSQWQNSKAEKEKIKQQGIYWLKEFKEGFPLLELPYDFKEARGDVDGLKAKNVNFKIEKKETNALKELAANLDITLFTLLLSIFTILLSKLSGQEDIVVASPVSCRKDADLQYIIGRFANTLALRNYPKKEKTVIKFIKEVKKRTLAAFENQDYRFKNLSEKVAVRFNFHTIGSIGLNDMLKSTGPADEDLALTNLEVTPYGIENHMSAFAINLTGQESRDRLFFTIAYKIKRFKKETIKKIIFLFEKIISVVLENPYKKISEVGGE